MRNLQKVLLGILIISSLILSGCGQKAVPPQGQKTVPPQKKLSFQKFVYNISAEPQYLDPGKATGIPEFTVILNLFDGLVRYDINNQIKPSIAEKWDISKDQTTYKFYLKKGVKWSNGEPVTAHDFEYSWKRALSPELGSEYAYQLWYLKNGEAYTSKKIIDPEQVGVKALDDYTLEVQLESPTPYFLSLLTFTTYLPVCKNVVEKNPDWAKSKDTYISNGPFKMKDWIHSDKIIVEKNPNYWDSDTVKIDEITFTMVESGTTELAMFESGQIDFAVNIPPVELDRLKAKGKVTIEPYIGTYYYLFNTTRLPFNDKRVRKALTFAIDRKAIVENITKGGQKVALAFVPYGIQDATTDQDFREKGGEFFSDNNVQEAKALLADAGYPDGKNFPKFKLLYNTSETHKSIAEAIQQMWKEKLGIECELTNQEWKVYLDNRSKLQFDVARAGWIGDYPDPTTFLDMFVSTSGNNDTGWKNPQYDNLILKAKSAKDDWLRMTFLHQAEEILMDEMPIMPIYFYTRPTMVKPWLKNYISSPLGYTDFKWAYIDEKLKSK
jgi:oligopeptide transport system substrate-binding protein